VDDLVNGVDDRPIPLGRAPVADVAAAGEVATSDHAPQETGAVTESPAATRSDREAAGAVAEAAPPPVDVAATLGRSGAPEPPGGHPLTGLRGLRLEPILVEPFHDARRDVARFLIEFALVMAFVYALIVAFVLLVAHVRGTPV
jgi:hypothetical protein